MATGDCSSAAWVHGCQLQPSSSLWALQGTALGTVPIPCSKLRGWFKASPVWDKRNAVPQSQATNAKVAPTYTSPNITIAIACHSIIIVIHHSSFLVLQKTNTLLFVHNRRPFFLDFVSQALGHGQVPNAKLTRLVGGQNGMWSLAEGLIGRTGLKPNLLHL